MTSDAGRLRRAKLIERVRSTEKRRAAADAFQAEAVRVKLEQLSQRTRSLAQLYSIRDSSHDGADLRSAAILGNHLIELGRNAAEQAGRAQQEADGKLADLAVAERRRQRAEERRRELHRSVIDQLARPDLSTNGKTGTHLE